MKKKMRVMTAIPFNAETPIESLRTWTTDNEVFFKRNQGQIMQRPVKLSAWKLAKLIGLKETYAWRIYGMFGRQAGTRLWPVQRTAGGAGSLRPPNGTYWVTRTTASGNMPSLSGLPEQRSQNPFKEISFGRLGFADVQPLRTRSALIFFCNEDGEIIGGVETFGDISPMLVDLERAQKIQSQALEHDLPQDPRLRFSTFFMSYDIVGGDFHAIRKLDEDRYGFLLADMEGHGNDIGSRMI